MGRPAFGPPNFRKRWPTQHTQHKVRTKVRSEDFWRRTCCFARARNAVAGPEILLYETVLWAPTPLASRMACDCGSTKSLLGRSNALRQIHVRPSQTLLQWSVEAPEALS